MEQTTAIDFDLINKITSFINEAGIVCRQGAIAAGTFLPGVEIQNGAIIYDATRLIWPGDLLHEAGHLAVLPPQHRMMANGSENLSGDIDSGAAEMAAIAWSWAAKEHLGIDAEIIFHSGGYKNGSDELIACYSKPFTGGAIMGVPILQLFGMTKSPQHGLNPGKDTYPSMMHWVRGE